VVPAATGALAELKGDITQQDIAERLEISGGAVSAWKNEGTLPDWQQVIAAARAYDADPLELMRIAFLSDDEVKKRTPKRST
jgi:transcriptional regulator with XRE-family HTH domain